MAKVNYELKVDNKFNLGKVIFELKNLGAKNIFSERNKRYDYYIKFTAPNYLVATQIKTKYNNIKEI